MATPDSLPLGGPLHGLRVIEMGQLIAGPFAGKTLGDFGADVIKIEPPGSGDPLRKWRLLHDGTSVWWQVQSRNKRSVALDLRERRGPGHRARAGRRGRRADRELQARHAGGLGPGLGRAACAQPAASSCCASRGYGQTGPYRDQPGFGVIGEAMGGLRHLTGEPGRVPVRVRRFDRRHAGGAARRDRRADGAASPQGVNGGAGQFIDVALYEVGVQRAWRACCPSTARSAPCASAAGSALPGIAPTNAYPLQRRLRAGRRQRRQHLQAADAARSAAPTWRPIRTLAEQRRPRRARRRDRCGDRGLDGGARRDEVLAALDAAERAGRPHLHRQDIADDPQYLARDMILRSAPRRRPRARRCPASCPSSARTPGAVAHRGAARWAKTPTRCCAEMACRRPRSRCCAPKASSPDEGRRCRRPRAAILRTIPGSAACPRGGSFLRRGHVEVNHVEKPHPRQRACAARDPGARRLHPLAARRRVAAPPLVVGFVYVSPIGDAGWTYQHELGRRELERALGPR